MGQQSNNNITSQMLSKPIADIIDTRRQLFDIDENESLLEAFNKLSREGITSLPVYTRNVENQENAVHDAYRGRHYIGLLSVLDIVGVVADSHLEGKAQEDMEQVLNVPVYEALGNSLEGRRIWVAWDNASIGDAMGPLTKGIRRLLVPVNEQGLKTLHLCSQLDIVRYLYEHRNDDMELHAKCASNLIDLGIILSEEDRREFAGSQTNTSMVISVEKDWRCSKALRFMSANNLHAVAVVDHTHQLVGTLSLSDLKRIQLQWLPTDPTVEELIACVRDVRSLDDVSPPITATPSTTLGQIIQKVLDGHVHRCWIVEEDRRRLVDVVTLTNILQALGWSGQEDDEEEKYE